MQLSSVVISRMCQVQTAAFQVLPLHYELADRPIIAQAIRHGLTSEQQDQIGLEGVTKQWPRPPVE